MPARVPSLNVNLCHTSYSHSLVPSSTPHQLYRAIQTCSALTATITTRQQTTNEKAKKTHQNTTRVKIKDYKKVQKRPDLWANGVLTNVACCPSWRPTRERQCPNTDMYVPPATISRQRLFSHPQGNKKLGPPILVGALRLSNRYNDINENRTSGRLRRGR